MTTIETRLERRVEADTSGLTVTDTTSGASIQAALLPDEARALAAALTGRGGQWTRDDLPSPKAVERNAENNSVWITSYDAEFVLGMIVDHLAAHYPKPDGDLQAVVNEGIRMKRQFNEQRIAREAAERDRDEWKARAEAAEARTAPAVTRDEVKAAIRGSKDEGDGAVGVYLVHEGEATNAVWSLVSGDDPAVYVVRESDIAAVEVHFDEHGHWIAGGRGAAMKRHSAEQVREDVAASLRCAIESEAVARAIEAEAVEDPVEAKAEELFGVAHPGATWSRMPQGVQRQYRAIATHVLGQEASDE